MKSMFRCDRRARIGLAAAAALWLAASPLAAQTAGGFRPERPNRALFGGGYGATEQSLILSGQLGGGIGKGSERSPIGADPTTPDENNSSSSVNWDGQISYALARERVSIGAGLASASRYFPASDLLTTANSANAELLLMVTRRTTVDARFGVSREPLSVLSLLPGLEDQTTLPLQSVDYGIGDGEVLYSRQEASVGLTQSLSTRANLTFSYHANRARATNEGVDRWSGGFLGSFSYGVGRGLALRLGYGLDEARYEATEFVPERRVRSHRVDAGVDFSRELSISRRTTLAFSTGTMVMLDEGRRRYEFVGTARVRREFGRSWQAAAGYDRNFDFVDVLTRPAFTESLTTSVSGLLGRRVNVVGDAGISHGEVGIAEANDYLVYRAGTGLIFGLTQHLGFGVHYSYFRYRFDNIQELSQTLSNTSFSRQTLRASIDVFAPIFHRTRRP